jgi:hypothetical protein
MFSPLCRTAMVLSLQQAPPLHDLPPMMACEAPRHTAVAALCGRWDAAQQSGCGRRPDA